MIYVENNSMDPYFSFGLEYYLMTEKRLPDDKIFMFWRTEPTVMVGKYQNTLEEINEQYVKEHRINVVRRLSGGGTIYTDPNGWEFTFISRGNAGKICFSEYIGPVVDALRKLGVNAGFNGRNDLVIDGRKISGNAQYMLGDRTLHHGSLLFDTNIEHMVRSTTVNEYKIVSKGIKSVRDRVTNIREHLPEDMDVMAFRDFMIGALMKDKESVYHLTDKDIQRVREISGEKFHNWQCIYGNSPKYNIVRTGRFPGGTVKFCFDVKKGIVEDVHIYGDFFGSGGVEELCEKLRGCRYREESIRKCLLNIDLREIFYNIKLDELIHAIV